MKISINSAPAFREYFHRANRANNFSYQACELLFDYFEDMDPEMELDVVGICCDYTEASIEDIISDYNLDIPEEEIDEDTGEVITEALDEDEIKDIVREYLEYRTSVVGETEDGFVFANF